MITSCTALPSSEALCSDITGIWEMPEGSVELHPDFVLTISLFGITETGNWSLADNTFTLVESGGYSVDFSVILSDNVMLWVDENGDGAAMVRQGYSFPRGGDQRLHGTWHNPAGGTIIVHANGSITDEFGMSGTWFVLENYFVQVFDISWLSFAIGSRYSVSGNTFTKIVYNTPFVYTRH
jgi:hypothetical protein